MATSTFDPLIGGMALSPVRHVAQARDDLADASVLLATAAQVEWVSNVAATYRARLDYVATVIAAVDQRVEAAGAAVCYLAGLE